MHDQGQDSHMQLSSLNKTFINLYGKEEQFNLFNVTGFYLQTVMS